MFNITVKEKLCTKCGVVKPAESFTKTRATKDNLHSNCKQCRKVSKKLSREENHEVWLAKEAAYREVKREVLRTYHKDWRKANPDKLKSHREQWLDKNRAYQKAHYKNKGRAIYLEKTYGITEEDYEVLLEKQFGLCAICGTDSQQRKRTLHVDHCHETGAIRGLLCPDCNMALGLFKDKTYLMQNAIHYIEEFKNGNS